MTFIDWFVKTKWNLLLYRRFHALLDQQPICLKPLMNLKSITVHLFHCPSDWTLPLLPGKWLSLCGCSHGSVHAEILAMKKEEVEKQKFFDEEAAQKLAEENLIAQANPELQELSNSQDSKISDSYIYYETVD